LASTNTVVQYGTIIQWNLEDSTSVNAATSTIAWYSTACPPTAIAGSSVDTKSTDTYWLVKTITFVPAVGNTTGGWVSLMEKDSSGPVLFRANIESANDVFSQTYDPPLRCRPIWWSTLAETFTTGAKWIFHLA